MANAYECDICQALYRPAKGCISATYNVIEKVEGEDATSQGWDIDICPACSGEFLKFVKHEEAAGEAAPGV